MAMQITADVFGLAVARPHTTETCALGAAINAAVAAGWYKDTDEAAANMTRVERVFEPDSVNVAIYRLGGSSCRRRKSPAGRAGGKKPGWSGSACPCPRAWWTGSTGSSRPRDTRPGPRPFATLSANGWCAGNGRKTTGLWREPSPLSTITTSGA
ncbi:MAG: hypothetical protein C4551_06770 [Bacillota bacterium]|nr:MAG: hypothetical protein C4551_06770 [Bacillota bacterium]